MWEHVNWERACLDLADSKTGPKTVHVNAPALQVLQALHDARKGESPWVLSGARKGWPLVSLPHAWQRIRAAAGLSGVRLHKRHSFASVAVASNTSLPIIGALLGHTQPATTARYAHLAADHLKEAAERTGERIAALLAPSGEPAPVIALAERRVAGRRRVHR
jgi:integrase